MSFSPQEALQRTIEHREIFFDEMVDLMRQIMRGDVSPMMTAAILTGLRVKKETIDEIAAAATVMREFALAVPVADTTHLVDIVGTGGDGSHTFNISTCAMFVAAAAGARVAKHGNRSVSSKSGSADAVEALGAAIELQPAQVAAAIDARMDEVYWGCYRETAGEMRLVGAEAVLPPEVAALPADATGEWFGAGTGWGYGERIGVAPSGQDAGMLPHAEDLLSLARFAWERGEAVAADQAQPVYLRDKVATPKAR